MSMIPSGKINKKKIAGTVEIICILLLTFGAAFLLVNLILDMRSRNNLKEIRETVKAARLQSEEITRPDNGYDDAADAGTDGDTDLATDTVNGTETGDAGVLETYRTFKEQNENFYGWLYVEGTDLDYPVMQGPDNEFYLSHNIERKYDKYGMLILDTDSSMEYESPQLIVYGHNVNSGDLFGELLYYKEEAFCGYHPVIGFDSCSQPGEYEIFAVFNTTVDEAQREQKLFTTWDFENKEQFDSMVEWAKSRSLYELDTVPEYGQPVLTLVTCEHSRDEGRFVVMAAMTAGEDK